MSGGSLFSSRLGLIPLETAVGVAGAAIAIALVIALSLGAVWFLRACRVRYIVGDGELAAYRGSRRIVQCRAVDIIDFGITEPLDRGDLLFVYPWPRFPYLWVKLQNESGDLSEIQFPRIAIWGQGAAADFETEVGRNLKLEPLK